LNVPKPLAVSKSIFARDGSKMESIINQFLERKEPIH